METIHSLDFKLLREYFENRRDDQKNKILHRFCVTPPRNKYLISDADLQSRLLNQNHHFIRRMFFGAVKDTLVPINHLTSRLD